MSASKRNKASETASDNSLIAGIQKHFATATLTLSGTSYTGTALVTLLQARVSAVQATITARSAYQAAVKAETQEIQETQAILNALKKSIYAMFTDPATLADFGLSPHKTPDITPAQRVAAAAKAKATREARGTMGSQQKKLVKGTVPSPSGSSSASSSSSTSGSSSPAVIPAPKT